MTPPSPTAESPASVFATALLAEFVRSGVRDAVLSPGSRSQALALAAAQFERAGLLRLHVRIDERVGGFTALGLAVESRTPVLVITTSGTAVANLHPAVLEAAHSGVPLVVLTGDRPEELRGVGANQTTRQPGIFGEPVERSWDVPAPTGGPDDAEAATRFARAALDGIAGPVHLNLAFREPLSSPARLPDLEPGTWAPAPPAGEALELRPHPGTVVVAGANAGPAAEEAARALGAPLLAEVASGARFGPNLVPAYRELLGAGNFGDRVERVVVFGHPTLSREVPALIERDGVETIVVRTPGVDDYDPGHRVARHVDVLTVADDPDAVQSARSWVGRWVHTSRELLAVDEPDAASLTDDYVERAAFARGLVERLREPVTRRMLVDAVWNASWPHDRLVLGASRLIRELDRVAPGKKLTVHANRGLAGIDGTVATATGVALAAQATDERGGITRVLLGDLALQHDLGSLLPAVGEAAPRLQVIVGNDGGGTIFDALEVAASAEQALLDRVLYTPSHLDLPALAAATGWEYRRVATRGDLDGALTPGPGRVLVEVVLARVERVA
jgi:2-succinyl-5-enolpyruvyl-6-hydroxy-3-cyclohexene-1-carboxylate synthase